MDSRTSCGEGASVAQSSVRPSAGLHMTAATCLLAVLVEELRENLGEEAEVASQAESQRGRQRLQEHRGVQHALEEGNLAPNSSLKSGRQLQQLRLRPRWSSLGQSLHLLPRRAVLANLRCRQPPAS